jgi:myo-inositol-1(or 4)-monophosphatase
MTFPPQAYLQKALRLAHQAALDAGEMAMAHFNPGAQTSAPIHYKEGGSPVTDADLAVDQLLRARLQGFDPAIGWLSEETEDDARRLECPLVWVVDPIDGTRAFAQGRPDWCIAIGLLAQGEPVLGVLHVPALGKTYQAHRGGGAWLNDAPIRVAACERAKGARLIGQDGVLDQVEGRAGPITRLPKIHSLAYRLAHVADGTAHGGLSSKNPHDWDLVAVHALINEAGGAMKQSDGGALNYNRASTRHPAVLAGHTLLVTDLCAILRAQADAKLTRDV